MLSCPGITVLNHSALIECCLLTTTLWSKTAKNTDWSTGPLPRPFARSLTPLTRPLAPDCLLRSRPPLHSLVRSLAQFAHSLARGKVNDSKDGFSIFFSILAHSAFLPAKISG